MQIMITLKRIVLNIKIFSDFDYSLWRELNNSRSPLIKVLKYCKLGWLVNKITRPSLYVCFVIGGLIELIKRSVQYYTFITLSFVFLTHLCMILLFCIFAWCLIPKQCAL